MLVGDRSERPSPLDLGDQALGVVGGNDRDRDRHRIARRPLDEHGVVELDTHVGSSLTEEQCRAVLEDKTPSGSQMAAGRRDGGDRPQAGRACD